MEEINSSSHSNRSKTLEKPNENDVNTRKNIEKRNSFIKIFLISITFLIIIAFVIIIVVLACRNKGKKGNMSEDTNLSEFKNITASYKVSKNEEIIVFNPEKIGLSSSEYLIKIGNKKRLRYLSLFELNEGKILSAIDGILNLTISIKKELSSLNGLFSGCRALKSIDLSDLNINTINNYDSLFKGCSSLETVNFPKNNSENVMSMNNMFDGCENIKEVNLTYFNISEETQMSNIFSGCNNLQNIDISSFNYITKEFFNGINSGVNILSNKYLSDSIRKEINILNLQINIFINDFIQQNLCKISEETKCKKCGSIFQFLCTECEEGYYLYTDHFLSTSCKSCQIDNCNKCYNFFGNVICSACNEGFNLIFNRCIPKDQNIVKECEKGDNEKCFSCNNEKGKEDQCLECNSGYYLPNNQNEKKFCKKCDIVRCTECFDNSNSNEVECKRCQKGYKLKNNKCILIVPDCTIGEGSLCSSCRTEDERLDECLTCNSGYFITTDETNNKSICSQCPIAFCVKCGIRNGNNICYDCENNYYLKNNECQACEIGEKEKCKTCGTIVGNCGSCNDGYILVKNGSCLKIENYVLVTYETNKRGASIRLFESKFYGYYITINRSDIQFFENNKEIFPISESGYVCEICGATADYFAYKFNEIGKHTIKIVFKSQLTTMKDFFNGCYNITSIKFSPSFDTSRVSNMECLFCFCENLVDLDISMFNTSNVVEMNFMFEGLYKIKTLDLSNFDTRKTVHMQLIFDYLYNLEYLDISSWNTSITSYCYGIFGQEESMAKNVTIKISNKLKYGRSKIWPTWKIINIDQL